MNSVEMMDDHDLIWYYKICMVNRFEKLRNVFGHYHPRYEGNTVYINKIGRFFALYHNQEEYILNEMWKRYTEASFYKRCWWDTKNIFQTKISFWKESDAKPIERKESKPYIVETLEYKGEIFTWIGSGYKRKAYLSPCKTYVIKVPKGDFPTLGEQENKVEYETYLKNPNSVYAKCEPIENNWLKMEYVEPKRFSKDDEYPEWVLSIAECQVGYNLEGKLVAYDYGSDI